MSRPDQRELNLDPDRTRLQETLRELDLPDPVDPRQLSPILLRLFQDLRLNVSQVTIFDHAVYDKGLVLELKKASFALALQSSEDPAELARSVIRWCLSHRLSIDAADHKYAEATFVPMPTQ